MKSGSRRWTVSWVVPVVSNIMEVKTNKYGTQAFRDIETTIFDPASVFLSIVYINHPETATPVREFLLPP